MDRIQAPGNIANQFTEGDPATGQAATEMDAAWPNGVQNELVGLIEDSELLPDIDDDQQIRQLLFRLVASNNLVFNANMMSLRRIRSTSVSESTSADISDGWTATCGAGVAITGITYGVSGAGRGFRITGSGDFGSTIKLSQAYNVLRRQTNMDMLNSAEHKTFLTSAIRFGSLSSNASVAYEVSISHRADDESGLLFDTLTNVDAIGGGTDNDVQGMALCRFSVQNLTNKQTSYFGGPEVTITLQETGSFTIYVYGVGMWNGMLPASYVPHAIVSDHLRDMGFINDLGVGSDTVYLNHVTAHTYIQTTSEMTIAVLTIPWKNKLQRVPLASEVTMSLSAANSATVYMGSSSISEQAWTSFDSVTIKDISSNGITLIIPANHAAITPATYMFAYVTGYVGVSMSD